MNILLAVTHIKRSNGGVCTHIIDLCKGMLNSNHNVFVISAGGEYEKELDELGVRHYYAPFEGIQKHPIKMIKTFF